MTTLEDLLKQKELHDKEWQKFYNEGNRIDVAIKAERNRLVFESNLLSQPVWTHIPTTKSSDYEQFEWRGADYWKEFSDISGEDGYHWSYKVIEDVLTVYCSDGDIYLKVAKDQLKECVDKFGLKLKTDNSEVIHIEEKIKSLEDTLNNIEYIKSLSN